MLLTSAVAMLNLRTPPVSCKSSSIKLIDDSGMTEDDSGMTEGNSAHEMVSVSLSLLLF